LVRHQYLKASKNTGGIDRRGHLALVTLGLFFLPGLLVAGVPVIQGVVDSAGDGPRVAPGSIASLFGTGLASGTTSAGTFPLNTTMSGTSVSVAGTLAPLLYVSPTQINFQVPSATTAGDVNVVVNGPGGASVAFSMTVTAEAPAIYQYGTGQAVAQNIDGSLNSDSSPAAAGSVITVYLTGQGAVSNPVTDGTAAPDSPLSSATATTTATIGPSPATVQFIGLTPGFAGLAQANIQVPSMPTGDYPLVITAGGLVSASAVISVSGSGTAYTSPLILTGSAAFTNSDTSTIALYNNVAYVCGEDRIVMVDVTNAAAPSTIGEFGDSVLNGSGDRCVVNPASNPPILVDIVGSPSGTAESFAIYSLADPSSPQLLTVATTPYGHMVDLSFSGTVGFLTTSYITYNNSNDAVVSQTGDFLVFDFSNPSLPAFVTYMQPSNLAGSGNQNLKPDAEVVDQVYSYVASSTASVASTTGSAILDVISISAPGIPTPVSQVKIPQAAILLSFDIAGNTLLAAGSTTGQRNPGTPDFDFTGYLTLTSMDLSNPQVPEVVSTITTSLQVNGTFYTAAFTNGVFAIVNNAPDTDDFGPSSLMIADARNPSNILLYPFQTQFGFSGILTTNTGYLLAPTALGLNIYKLQLQ
jgi:uncharacterized protein (TIGR03437 family)